MLEIQSKLCGWIPKHLSIQKLHQGKSRLLKPKNLKWLPSELHWLSTLSVAEVGYFVGGLVEFILEIVLTAVFTGGSITPVSILKKIGKEFNDLAQAILKVVQSFFKNIGQFAGNIYSQLLYLIEQGAEKFAQLLDEIYAVVKEWVGEMLGRIKVMLLINGARQAVYVDFLGVTVISKILSRSFARKMAKHGLKMAEFDGLYHIYYKGERIFSGTVKQANDFLAPYLKKNGDSLKKSLDGLIDDLVTSQKNWNNFTFDMLMGNPPPPKRPCFAAGTLVTCKTGLKPIEQIQIGEIVLSRNMKTSQNEWKTVTETFTNFANELVQIELEGESIKATGQHTFWLPKKNKWTKAIDLRTGDIFLSQAGGFKTISNIEIKKKKAATYNLEVEANHNYFVGQNQVLTHNKARVSKFADTKLYEVEFYNLQDVNRNDIYVGQTTQGAGKRYVQHVYEGKTTTKKSKLWKKAVTGSNYVMNFPGPIRVTAYEAAVIELYEIQLLRSKGGVVYNSQKPIGAKKFKKFKDMGNPCRLYN